MNMPQKVRKLFGAFFILLIFTNYLLKYILRLEYNS